MGRMVAIGALFLGLLAVASGCQSSIAKERDDLVRQNRELQSRNEQKEAELNQRPDPQAYAALQAENARLEAENKKLQDSLRQPAPQANPAATAQEDLGGITVTRDKAAGTVTVNLPGDVLFDSGKAMLKPSAGATLDKIISALKKDYAGKHVFVDGYSDSDPINKTKEKWQDNLDLSAQRARSVAGYLTAHGLNERQVAPRAFGATNLKSTPAASRRVEIVVATR